MKKTLTIVTTLLMLFSLPLVANAVTGSSDMINYQNSELDLSQYTVQDLVEMPATELSALVAEFERIYDPFGSYKKRQAENIVDLAPSGNTVSPLWTSGEDPFIGDYVARTHDVITAQACYVLLNDIGFFGNNTAESMAATLSIVLASSLPDQDETDGIFKGHFYDPDTEENYKGETDYTAKTNAVAHFRNAYSAAGNNDLATLYEELGRALHYVQDANVPHHAANVVSLGPLSSHSKFEKMAEENIDDYLEGLDSLTSDNYTTIANNNTVANIVKIGAQDAKGKMLDIEENDANSYKWHEAARFCTRKAVKYSAIVMYKMGQRSEVPFYYN